MLQIFLHCQLHRLNRSDLRHRLDRLRLSDHNILHFLSRRLLQLVQKYQFLRLNPESQFLLEHLLILLNLLVLLHRLILLPRLIRLDQYLLLPLSDPHFHQFRLHQLNL